MVLGSSSSSALLGGVLVGLLSYLAQQAEGHAYLMTPVSRNFWATDAFQDTSYPDINWCPHCFQSRGPAAVRARAEEHTDPEELKLYGGGAWPHFSAYERNELASNGNYYEPDSIAVRHGICGDPEQTAEEGSNLFGKDNTNYPVLETYAEGSVMEVKVVVSANHWGHLEFFVCNADDMTDPDGVVTQGCFNMHPLDRAEDDDTASRIDPNHVGRYFLDPTCRATETDQTLTAGAFTGDVVTARYQLPEGLTCSRCIVQMVYYTGNSCKHPGYDDFNPSSWGSECAPNTADWINTDVGMCGDGDAYPEEFWNCADIEITSDGDSSPKVPSPSTTSSDPEPTWAPETDEPAADPTVEPTPTPVSDSGDASPTDEPTMAPYTEEPTMYNEDYTPAPVNEDLDHEDEPSDSESEDASPTVEPTPTPVSDSGDASPTDEPTMAPYTEEPTMYNEDYTPAPVEDDDDPEDEPTPAPETTSLAPATFAPSVPAPTPEGEECDDPVGAFAQCGGGDYDGSTCCRPGYECTVLADCYSACRPIEDGCAEEWAQCGGDNWDGPTCCMNDGVCKERSEWFFQCVPANP